MPSIRIMFNNEDVRQVSLNQDAHIIGRQEGCDICIDNLGISRNHARIIKKNESFYIEDLNSSNGTFLNGAKIQSQELKEGDIITIGKYEMSFNNEETEIAGEQKNSPSPPPAAADTMNTMEMNSEDIRRRMAEMAKERGTVTEIASSDSVPKDTARIEHSTLNALEKTGKEKLSSAEQAEIRAREAELEILRRDMRRSKIILLTILVICLIVIAGIFALK